MKDILDQVDSTRRRFLARLVGGGAALALLAAPTSAVLQAQGQDDDQAQGRGKGKGQGKGDEAQ